MSTSDTPRTDSAVTGNSDPTRDEYEDLAWHARQLERELAAANARIAALERDKARLDWLDDPDTIEMRARSLRAAIDAAMTPPPNNLPHA